MRLKIISLVLALLVLPGLVFAGDINPQNFNTVNNSYYEGINVGWDIATTGLQNDGSYLQEVIVKLYSGDTLLAVNYGNVPKLQELSSQGVTIYSTPFITNNKTYPEDEYWDFTWETVPTEETKPTKAEIIYKYSPAREDSWEYGSGAEEIVVENTNLVEPNENTWESLSIDESYVSELIPEDEVEKTKSGGGGINLRKKAFDTWGESVALEVFDLLREYEDYENETKLMNWKNQNRLDFVEKVSDNKYRVIKSFSIKQEE